MHHTPLFQDFEYYSSKWYIFKNTELGRIYDSIPWEALSTCLPQQKKNRPGAVNWFSNAGMFGVMFLKHYTNLSDEKLLDRINTDWALQLFCGILLQDHEQIKDRAIVSRIRGKISLQADLITDVQKKLIDHWSGYMKDTDELHMDASCYESYIRFPTDVKLLWKCCNWVFEKQLFRYCKELGIKRPISKYNEQIIKQLSYSRKKRKTYKQTRARRKSLLYLLSKGIKQLKETISTNQTQLNIRLGYYTTIATVEKILEQQQYLFDNPQGRVEERIVSLHKPYVRPIKRGKENKSTEFGMKLHKVQVDGVSQIDRMSFDNFNECTRLQPCVQEHKNQFGECNRLGADQIYATNANRSFLAPLNIVTCFPKKGKDNSTKEEKKIRSAIGKTRSTKLEGSFGNEKNHYGLRKVKALSQGTEKVWVFFGIMTTNAVLISKRKPPDQRQAA
ncbi:MAG: transposase [Candidatus Scalindua sp.]